MLKSVQNNHWRNQNKPYSCAEACCDVNTGYHFCCFTSKSTDIEKMGVGISLYFKFIKYLKDSEVFFLRKFKIVKYYNPSPFMFYGLSKSSIYKLT